jgi:hypothetical protein
MVGNSARKAKELAMSRKRDMDMKSRHTEPSQSSRQFSKSPEKRRLALRNTLITIGVCIAIAVLLALVDGAMRPHP